MLSASSASDKASAAAVPITGASPARAPAAAVCRAVIPGPTVTAGGSSSRRSAMASSMSCSVGSQSRCGLGVPLGVIARLKLPNTSYSELASPIPGSSCG